MMLQCSTGANLPSIVADPDFSPPECVFHSYCIYLIFAEICWYHSTERLCGRCSVDHMISEMMTGEYPPYATFA